MEYLMVLNFRGANKAWKYSGGDTYKGMNKNHYEVLTVERHR